MDRGDAGDDLIGQQLVHPELLLLDFVDGDVVVVVSEELVIVIFKLLHLECRVFREGVGVPEPAGAGCARQYSDVTARTKCLLKNLDDLFPPKLLSSHLRSTAEATGAVGAGAPVVARGVGPLEYALLARNPVMEENGGEIFYKMLLIKNHRTMGGGSGAETICLLTHC